ncbi:hypothetical protein SORBI_3001G541166 [Sorghum bicolor]|uniref:Uncharacterized protein n=1 Tax=Sorghum bicolor TaxID=4558 RepID=A0A1Z5SCC7_SORBI|nr:hypothetical protein SORBI_3001G541166 [Sorghum bicolor]
MQDERAGALLDAEAPHGHLLEQRLRLRLREAACLHRHEAGRREHCPPGRRLVSRRGRAVPLHHAPLDPRLDQEALDLGGDVGGRADGVQGLEQEDAGLERLEQVRGEGQLAAVTAAVVHGNDKLGAKAPDEVKDGWHRGGVHRAGRKVDGDRVAGGDGDELRGVHGVEVEEGQLERDAGLGGEVGQVLVDQLQLQRVVVVRLRRRGHQCGDLERGAGARTAARQLLHERRPLLADADVEVEHVDAGGAAELVEHGLDAGEVRELEHGADLGEGLVGAEL